MSGEAQDRAYAIRQAAEELVRLSIDMGEWRRVPEPAFVDLLDALVGGAPAGESEKGAGREALEVHLRHIYETLNHDVPWQDTTQYLSGYIERVLAAAPAQRTAAPEELPPLPVWSEAQFRADCVLSGLEPGDPHMLEAYGWGFRRAVRLLRGAAPEGEPGLREAVWKLCEAEAQHRDGLSGKVKARTYYSGRVSALEWVLAELDWRTSAPEAGGGA